MSDTESSHMDRASQFWLTALIERFQKQYNNPLLVTAVFFGGPPALIVAVYVGIRWEYMTPTYLFSLASLLVVTTTAPYLIWYYDVQLFPEFRKNVRPLLQKPAVIDSIGQRYHSLLATWWWIPAIMAALPIPFLLLFGKPFLRQHGLFGLSDPVFWMVMAVLLWICIIVGTGFLLTVITLLVIREIAAEPIKIDPLHPDGLGGMSTIGHYAIHTTTLFSLGALLLPLHLQYAATVGSTATMISYSMGSLYGVFIIGSFLYPTILINRKAESIRKENLDTLRQQYTDLKQAADEPVVGVDVETTDPAVEQKLHRLQKEYREHRDVRLYPLRVSILIRLVSSVVFPATIIVTEYMINIFV